MTFIRCIMFMVWRSYVLTVNWYHQLWTAYWSMNANCRSRVKTRRGLRPCSSPLAYQDWRENRLEPCHPCPFLQNYFPRQRKANRLFKSHFRIHTCSESGWARVFQNHRFRQLGLASRGSHPSKSICPSHRGRTGTVVYTSFLKAISILNDSTALFAKNRFSHFVDHFSWD